MNIRHYNIEFLTPCFCAGARQTKAELRASAVRGQLRWWFRALGGSAEEERAIFGGVLGDKPLASTITVRITQCPEGGQKDWNRKIPKKGTASPTYLLGFFCGRTHRLDDAAGALPPGSKARITIITRGAPSRRLDQALRVFFSVGALGFRATRAAGAFSSEEHRLTASSWQQLSDDLTANGFTVGLRPADFRDWERLIHAAGQLLKNTLRSKKEGLGISAGENGSQPNALGSADPRQASGVHFRPVRIDGKLRLALIEAPHRRILGEQALRAHGGRGSVLKLAGLAT